MAVSQISAVLPACVERVWSVVTNLEEYAWRSDLREIRVLNDRQFVEVTAEGYPTTFTVTERESCRRWAFSMENSRMRGRWVGTFVPRGGSETAITFTEEVRAKAVWLRPFVGRYLRKQQARYVADLRSVLLKSARN